MKNFILLLASFLPMILITLFADPIQGAFKVNLGSISSTFIAGLLGFIVLKKYKSPIGWLIILSLGLYIASLC